jgi:hypothetical protein
MGNANLVRLTRSRVSKAKAQAIRQVGPMAARVATKAYMPRAMRVLAETAVLAALVVWSQARPVTEAAS